jgi:hypothetical protein
MVLGSMPSLPLRRPGSFRSAATNAEMARSLTPFRLRGEQCCSNRSSVAA